jgi:transposase
MSPTSARIACVVGEDAAQGGKTIVLRLLKQDDQVYTEIVPNASKATLQAIIRGKVKLESVLHTDGRRGYDGLVEIGYDKHRRVNHGDNEFALGPNHINGTESFWSFAKHKLSTFHGVSKSTFSLHLKETEFRFNQRKKKPLQTATIHPQKGAALTPFAS